MVVFSGSLLLESKIQPDTAYQKQQVNGFMQLSELISHSCFSYPDDAVTTSLQKAEKRVTEVDNPALHEIVTDSYTIDSLLAG